MVHHNLVSLPKHRAESDASLGGAVWSCLMLMRLARLGLWADGAAEVRSEFSPEKRHGSTAHTEHTTALHLSHISTQYRVRHCQASFLLCGLFGLYETWLSLFFVVVYPGQRRLAEAQWECVDDPLALTRWRTRAPAGVKTPMRARWTPPNPLFFTSGSLVQGIRWVIMIHDLMK